MEDSEIQRVWSEIRATGSLNFKYLQQATPYELAPFISANMLNYPSNHIISAGYLLDEIDVKLFRSYVEKLTPASAVTVLRSRTFSWLADDTPNDATPPQKDAKQGEGANRKEPWYGVSYHTEAPSPQLLDAWTGSREGRDKGFSLSLPGPNPFICYELADADMSARPFLSTPSSPSSSSVAVGLDGGAEEELSAVRVLRSKPPTPVLKGEIKNEMK